MRWLPICNLHLKQQNHTLPLMIMFMTFIHQFHTIKSMVILTFKHFRINNFKYQQQLQQACSGSAEKETH